MGNLYDVYYPRRRDLDMDVPWSYLEGLAMARGYDGALAENKWDGQWSRLAGDHWVEITWEQAVAALTAMTPLKGRQDARMPARRKHGMY